MSKHSLTSSLSALAAVLIVCLSQLAWPQYGWADDKAAGDEAAKAYCRSLAAAEYAHYAKTGHYGTVEELVAGKFISPPESTPPGVPLRQYISVPRGGEHFLICIATSAGGFWYAGETGEIKRLDAVLAAQLLLAGSSPQTELAAGANSAAVTQVLLETTAGDILLEVHPEWSPLGAAHFLELVEAKFYDGAPWFRVIEGFVAQCGIAADPELNAEWSELTIKDEPVVQGNKPSFVAFGKSYQPDTRSTHIFINFADNRYALDEQGFACFAQVVEGMDVALKLYKCEWGDQQGLTMEGGLARFAEEFPEADYIVRAFVVQPKSQLE